MRLKSEKARTFASAEIRLWIVGTSLHWSTNELLISFATLQKESMVALVRVLLLAENSTSQTPASFPLPCLNATKIDLQRYSLDQRSFFHL